MFDRAFGERAYEVPLQHEEEHDYRHTHNERRRHQPRPVGGVLSKELLQTDWHRHQLLGVDERPRVDVLIPALDERIDRGRYESRSGEGQDYLPERLEPSRPVDSCCALELARDIVLEAFQQPDGKG